MVLAATEWAQVVLAAAASLLAVSSFWWVHLYRGRLEVSEPDVFSRWIDDDTVRVRLPLVVANTGANAVAIASLRVSVDDHRLRWVGVHQSLASEERPEFPSPFAVGGRQARQFIAEFAEYRPQWTPKLGSRYPLRIELKTRRGWRTVAMFEWCVPKSAAMGWDPYWNSPDGLFTYFESPSP